MQKASGFARRLERLEVPVSRSWGYLIRAGIAHVRGDIDGSVALLEEAKKGLVESESMLHLAALKTRLGQMLGADAGEALITEAREWMHTHGVAVPDRFVAMLAPGW